MVLALFLLLVTAAVGSIAQQQQQQCDDGWEQHDSVCYRAFTQPSSFVDAQGTCALHNARLAEPSATSTTFHRFLAQIGSAAAARARLTFAFLWLGIVRKANYWTTAVGARQLSSDERWLVPPAESLSGHCVAMLVSPLSDAPAWIKAQRNRSLAIACGQTESGFFCERPLGSGAELVVVGDRLLRANDVDVRDSYDDWRIWPNGVVYYRFRYSGRRTRRRLRRSIKELQRQLPCGVTFQELKRRQRRNDYVQIERPRHLHAFADVERVCATDSIGRKGGVQSVLVGKRASDAQLHRALMHVLGVPLEHRRFDRDDYIHLDLSTVPTNWRHEFFSALPFDCVWANVSYDYTSLMHSPPKALSILGEQTIVPIDSSAAIGQAKAISKSDIAKVANLYSCDGQPSNCLKSRAALRALATSSTFEECVCPAVPLEVQPVVIAAAASLEIEQQLSNATTTTPIPIDPSQAEAEVIYRTGFSEEQSQLIAEAVKAAIDIGFDDTEALRERITAAVQDLFGPPKRNWSVVVFFGDRCSASVVFGHYALRLRFADLSIGIYRPRGEKANRKLRVGEAFQARVREISPRGGFFSKARYRNVAREVVLEALDKYDQSRRRGQFVVRQLSKRLGGEIQVIYHEAKSFSYRRLRFTDGGVRVIVGMHMFTITRSSA